jgi:hypothetical protein
MDLQEEGKKEGNRECEEKWQTRVISNNNDIRMFLNEFSLTVKTR